MSSYVDLRASNGTIYVYESTGHWDKEKKMCVCERKCVGKRNLETGEIIFSKKHLTQQAAEVQARRGPKPSPEYRRYFSGATYLMDSLGEKLGITDDLKRCFPDTYKKILSLAYYLVLEGGESYLPVSQVVDIP